MRRVLLTSFVLVPFLAVLLIGCGGGEKKAEVPKETVPAPAPPKKSSVEQ